MLLSCIANAAFVSILKCCCELTSSQDKVALQAASRDTDIEGGLLSGLLHHICGLEELVNDTQKQNNETRKKIRKKLKASQCDFLSTSKLTFHDGVLDELNELVNEGHDGSLRCTA